MKINEYLKYAMSTGVFGLMMAVGANAATVTFQTDMGTGFNGSTQLTLASSGGVAGTLAFVPDPSMTVGAGNVNYGNFTLTCATCTITAGGISTSFSAFNFNMRVTDTSDGATGQFVGSAAAGQVFLDSSMITITWLPLVLGPGSSNALTGNFGLTTFSTTPTTRIVNPISGAQIGSTTVQGAVTVAPEPATFGIVGAALLGLVALRRKYFVA